MQKDELHQGDAGFASQLYKSPLPTLNDFQSDEDNSTIFKK